MAPGRATGCALVITCEHGGNEIPAPYRDLFSQQQALLDTHRGFDAGALIMAEELADAFGAPLLTATVSRLLVDLNRSIGHPQLHFDAVRNEPATVRRDILKRHYQPYRTQAEQLVAQAVAKYGRVIHISSHSFTPELDGEIRNTDVGLQYDPAHPGELDFCKRWKSAFKECEPDFVVRRNYPYAGWNDGLTTTLRKAFPADAYIGIELELNQKYVAQGGPQWTSLRQAVTASLCAVLKNRESTRHERRKAGATP